MPLVGEAAAGSPQAAVTWVLTILQVRIQELYLAQKATLSCQTQSSRWTMPLVPYIPAIFLLDFQAD